jgi:hypothetical protein
MKICEKLLLAGSSLAGALAWVSAANAAVMTINHIDRGAINSQFVRQEDLGHKIGSGSHQVRFIRDQSGVVRQSTRNYFAFDLGAAGVPGTIISAELRFRHPGNSYPVANGPHERVEFFNVTTPAATLQGLSTAQPDPTCNGTTTSGCSDAIFDDLGTGTGYGGFTASVQSNGVQETVQLNCAAVADLNAAVGRWVIGGANVTPSPNDALQASGFVDRVLVGSSEAGSPPAQLVLTTAEPGQSLQCVVKVPVLGQTWQAAGLVSLLAGLGVVSMRARRGRRQA